MRDPIHNEFILKIDQEINYFELHCIQKSMFGRTSYKFKGKGTINLKENVLDFDNKQESLNNLKELLADLSIIDYNVSIDTLTFIHYENRKIHILYNNDQKLLLMNPTNALNVGCYDFDC